MTEPLKNNRIRYKKTSTPGELVSVQTFLVNNQEYAVTLTTDPRSFTITNIGSLETALTGSGTSMHSVKINAKQALETLGVVFEDEKRSKRGARKPKPMKPNSDAAIALAQELLQKESEQ